MVSLFLLSSVAAAEDIELIPVQIGAASAVYTADVFERNREEAAKAGLDLAAEADRYIAKGYANDRAFILFYNHAAAPRCRRDYLIQRVVLTKQRDVGEGRLITEQSYLVEAMKLNADKRTKKPDEHRKGYSRGEARRRTLTAEYEIGCGEVRGVAQGDAWPFESNKLYRLIQNYQGPADLYNDVRFDFSRVYRFEMQFDDAGRHSIVAPDFIPAPAP